MKKIFLICPVTNATEQQKKAMRDYITQKESEGYKVFYPARDNPFEETDNKGLDICYCNVMAIDDAHEVHIFFDSKSKGSLFDIGAAFALDKKIVIANKGELERTSTKSFTNMILEWSEEQL